MKTIKERRASRTIPYSIGKPNIYGPPYKSSTSQTEKRETREKENITPPPNENDISHNSNVIPPVHNDHAGESCVACFLEFHADLQKYFQAELARTTFFLHLCNNVLNSARKIIKRCQANSDSISLEDIIQIADPNNG